MNKIRTVLLAVALAAPVMGPNRSSAEGAVAIGSTGNVATDGVALGVGFNYATRQGAIDRALAECHAQQDAPSATRALCTIVGTFRNQCAVFAMDPEPGTPGVGWAIATSKQKAASEALGNCRATAGASRRQFCVVSLTDCDTKTPKQ